MTDYLDIIKDFGDIDITYDSTNLKSVIRYLKVRRIFERYIYLRKEKHIAIKNQQYEKAALLRDMQKEEIDRISCLLK